MPIIFIDGCLLVFDVQQEVAIQSVLSEALHRIQLVFIFTREGSERQAVRVGVRFVADEGGRE